MIDKIVLNILDDRWTDTATDWLFATASLTDPRIHPVFHENAGAVDDIRRELTPSSLLVDCHSFPPELSDVDVCIGVNGDWSAPGKELVSRVSDPFERRGYKVGVNTPYANSFAPHMPFPYPSVMIEVNKGTYLDGNGELDLKKATKLKEAIGEMYSMILDDELALLEIYKNSFPLLFRNRERIWSDPRMACSEVVGFRILGKMHVSLGAMLRAIEDSGDLFRYGPDGVVCYFAGNPMTGTTTNRVADLRTGLVSTRKDGSFHARAVAIRSALRTYPVSRKGTLPLTVIIGKLSDGG